MVAPPPNGRDSQLPMRAQTLRLPIAAALRDPVVYEDRHRFASVVTLVLARLSPMPTNTTTDAAAFSNKVYDILAVGGGTAGLALANRSGRGTSRGRTIDSHRARRDQGHG